MNFNILLCSTDFLFTTSPVFLLEGWNLFPLFVFTFFLQLKSESFLDWHSHALDLMQEP